MRGMVAREPLTTDRWLGAICYLTILVLLPMLVREKSAFLARHCRQGFAILFAEVVILLLLAAIDKTIGLIPVLGFLISILLHLAFFMIFLLLSALGFVKALSGERWDLPGLDELADRVPVHPFEDEEILGPRRAVAYRAEPPFAETVVPVPRPAPVPPAPVAPVQPPAPPEPRAALPDALEPVERPLEADDELDEHATRGGDAF